MPTIVDIEEKVGSLYGDGSDGDFTSSSVVDISTPILVKQYKNLTINHDLTISGVVFIRVQDTFNLNATFKVLATGNSILWLDIVDDMLGVIVLSNRIIGTGTFDISGGDILIVTKHLDSGISFNLSNANKVIVYD